MRPSDRWLVAWFTALALVQAAGFYYLAVRVIIR